MADFLTGLAQGFGVEIEARNKKKLEIALLSKRIEAEIMQKEREQQMKVIPQEQFGKTLGALGAPTGLDTTGIQHPEAQGALLGAFKPLTGIQARGHRPQRPQLRNVDGQVVEISFNEAGERKISPIGATPQAHAKAVEIESRFADADSALEQIGEMSSKFLVNGNILQTLPAGAATKLSALFQTNADAAAYLDDLEFFALQITAGESGKQMTNEERKAVLKALPQLTDSIQTATKKISTLRERYENVRNRKLKTVLKTTAEIVGDSQKDKEKPVGRSKYKIEVE